MYFCKSVNMDTDFNAGSQLHVAGDVCSVLMILLIHDVSDCSRVKLLG